MQKNFLFLFVFILGFVNELVCQRTNKDVLKAEDAIVGASRLELYLNKLKGKKVGIVANQTSIFNGTHLIDTLLNEGVDVIKIFTPEHGFRGNVDEGALIDNSIDEKTQLPIISLYGNNKKPDESQLVGIDIMIFDLQDVGTRFYTYISTMTYIMEAVAENNIPLIVLDRPNPNGFYVDGPVLETENKSFVGLHQVPVVYGLTIGEYALMVNGEYWLNDSLQCDLTVIPLDDYERNAIYELPVKPSPNLPNWESVYLYPSLCLFEGTIVSVGRGTESPFQVYGHPKMTGDFAFTPRQSDGRRAPLLCDEECRGEYLMTYAHDFRANKNQINLGWIINAYNQLKEESRFFNSFFVKLSGTKELQQQIEQGMTEKEIRATWKEGLDNYNKIRDKYLMY